MPKPYDYAMLYRPPSIATVPNGFTSFLPPTSEYRFGGVRYDRPLSRDDIERYELRPLDPNHPVNLRREFEAFRTRFIQEFVDANETWKIGSNILVTRSTVPGVEWQMTFFSDGIPTGHLDFDDFEELAIKVWGIERAAGKKDIEEPEEATVPTLR